MSDSNESACSSWTNPEFDHLANELEAFELMTAGYVGSIVRAAGQIPEDKWNWSFSERTPSAREICEHTYMWLWCDRQQITELDRTRHQPVPDLPVDRLQMIQLLKDEAIEWRRLIRSITTEQLQEERESWKGKTRLIRSFLFHMGQHVVYKAGQIWMIAYELDLEGDGAYSAPHPNEDYGFSLKAPWPASRV
jgi:uncharacterized damage-inducible protein DinB